MAKVDVLAFEAALEATAKAKQRHLLLGNGFSMAWKSDEFAYGALFDQADFWKLSKPVRKMFKALGTKNFELVMKALRDAAKVIEVYAKDGAESSKRFTEDADALREVLAQAIAASHPNMPGDVSDLKYRDPAR